MSITTILVNPASYAILHCIVISTLMLCISAIVPYSVNTTKKEKKSKTTKCPFMPTIPSAFFFFFLVGEGRGKGHSQNWPNNLRHHHPISFLSSIHAQSPRFLTESLKTRLICILSPCQHL